MIILPMPMAFGAIRPTSRCYSLVVKTADGRPVYIKLYGKPGLGREAFTAGKSVLRPSAEPVWDMEDEREPVGWTLLFSTMGVALVGVFGVIAIMIVDMAGFLPTDYFMTGGWGTLWTRTCLVLWPLVICGALFFRRLNRPGP